MTFQRPRPGHDGTGATGYSSQALAGAKSTSDPRPNQQPVYRTILRSDGAEILVDCQDYERLRRKRWFPAGTDGRYAGRTEVTGGVSRRIYIHREIMSPPPGCVVDHLDGDGLNNTRANLRIASRSENSANRTITRNSTGFHGVCTDPDGERYQASVTKDGARYRGPWRHDPETAANDYDAMARGIHGDFAVLNFPRSDERGVERSMPQGGAE